MPTVTTGLHPHAGVAQPGLPPVELFHGTSPAAAEAIRVEGLRPMGRHYVHLSVDRATARAVGARKSREPVIVVVGARAAPCGLIRYLRLYGAIETGSRNTKDSQGAIFRRLVDIVP